MKARIAVVLAVALLSVGIESPALAKSKPKPVPSLAKIKRAISSTGVTLCLQGGGPTGFPNNYWEYAGSQDGDCSTAVTPGGELVLIVAESTNAAAKRDITQIQGMGLGLDLWTNQSAAVFASNPLPGTNAALRALGFKRA